LKVAIVGAGPAGTLTSLNLSEKAEIVIFEAKQSPGFPVKCGGLISEDCFKELKKYCKVERSLINKIRGAFFISPSGKYAEVAGKTGSAVIERKILDSMLLKEAGKIADIRMKSRVFEISENTIKIVSQKEKYSEAFDAVIGADGAESIVAKELGFERPEIFSGKQYLMEFEAIQKDMVELYFGKRYSDGFFGYAIPLSEDVARVGVVSRENPSQYLERLIDEHPSVSERIGRSVFEVNSGAIPIGLINFVMGNAVLIGDAAGMVKPYTGGGIYYLLKAAEMLGEFFPDLRKFRQTYMSRLSREYTVGERIRRLYDILDTKDYDTLVEIAREIDFSEVHMDRPSTALSALPKIFKMVKNVSLASKMVRAFFQFQ